MREKQNPKKECPECHRLLRTRCFAKKENPIRQQILCKQCDRRIGHNKFYNPETDKQRKAIWSQKTTNRQILYKNYISQGFSPEEAAKKCNQHAKWMRGQIARKRRAQFMKGFWARKNKEKAANQRKQFLEGLKQA